MFLPTNVLKVKYSSKNTIIDLQRLFIFVKFSRQDNRKILSESLTKDYSSLINPRNKIVNVTSEDVGRESKRGDRTGKFVRFLDRRRRDSTSRVAMVEDIEPRRPMNTVHHHHHHYEDIQVLHWSFFQYIIIYCYQTDGICLAGYVCCKPSSDDVSNTLLYDEIITSSNDETVRLTRQPISVDGHVSLPRGTCGHRQPGTQGRISSKGQLDNPDGLTQFGEIKTQAMFTTKHILQESIHGMLQFSRGKSLTISTSVEVL